MTLNSGPVNSMPRWWECMEVWSLVIHGGRASARWWANSPTSLEQLRLGSTSPQYPTVVSSPQSLLHKLRKQNKTAWRSWRLLDAGWPASCQVLPGYLYICITVVVNETQILGVNDYNNSETLNVLWMFLAHRIWVNRPLKGTFVISLQLNKDFIIVSTTLIIFIQVASHFNTKCQFKDMKLKWKAKCRKLASLSLRF